MSTRTLALLLLVPTVLALTACGIVRRQDRREDRRDLAPTSSIPAAALSLPAAQHA
jgi:hypothetical protein